MTATGREQVRYRFSGRICRVFFRGRSRDRAGAQQMIVNRLGGIFRGLGQALEDPTLAVSRIASGREPRLAWRLMSDVDMCIGEGRSPTDGTWKLLPLDACIPPRVPLPAWRGIFETQPAPPQGPDRGDLLDQATREYRQTGVRSG